MTIDVLSTEAAVVEGDTATVEATVEIVFASRARTAQWRFHLVADGARWVVWSLDERP